MLALAVVVGCASGPERGEADRELLVLAAASLADALPAVGEAYTRTHPDVRVVYSFAGSQTLLAQLRAGIRADVLVVADAALADAAVKEGLVRAPVVVATNRLVIVVPAGDPAGVSGPADLARDGVRVVLAGEAVPAGRYAREILVDLGLWAGVQRRLVSVEDDVRGVLGKVVTGEADAGVVYRTDALVAGDRVETRPLPGDLVARYPAAVVVGAPHPGDATDFVAFLRGDGQALLRRAGFGTP